MVYNQTVFAAVLHRVPAPATHSFITTRVLLSKRIQICCKLELKLSMRDSFAKLDFALQRELESTRLVVSLEEGRLANLINFVPVAEIILFYFNFSL